MAKSDFFEVDGLRELDIQLKRIGEFTAQWKVIRPALAKSLRTTKNATKASYESIAKTGTLARTLKQFSSKKYQSVAIGWKWPKKLSDKQKAKHKAAGTRSPFYGPMVELGFKHKGGKSIPGRFFLRRAFDTNLEKMVIIYGIELEKQIDKALSR